MGNDKHLKVKLYRSIKSGVAILTSVKEIHARIQVFYICTQSQSAFHCIGKYHKNTDVMTIQHMVIDNTRCQGWYLKKLKYNWNEETYKKKWNI